MELTGNTRKQKTLLYAAQSRPVDFTAAGAETNYVAGIFP